MTRTRWLFLIFIAQFFLVLSLCAENDNDKEILKQTLPAYTIISNTQYLNSTRCRKELEELREAIDRRRLWSLKVLDSSGKPNPGFIYGNNYWLGSRSQCEDATNKNPFAISLKEIMNNSKYRHVEDEFPPFDVNYFAAHILHNSTLQYHVEFPNENMITFGMCLPDSCTTNEITVILENIFKNRILIFSDLYAVDFKLVEVKNLKDDHLWLINESFIIVGFIILITLLLMGIGTVYDVRLFRKRKRNHKMLHSCENNNMSIQLGTKQPDEDPEDRKINTASRSTLGKILQAFSIYTNTKLIFSTKLQSDSVPVIHGLRFLGMMWIIMVHTLFFTSDFIDNKPLSWRKADNFFAQIVSNATFSVDTFFLISGFLLTYMFLRSKEGKETHQSFTFINEAKKFLLIFLKRFIRLTPPYLMAMGIHVINSQWYSKVVPFYMNERGYEECPKHWWRNILYIQNMFSMQSMCMTWSWYLAADMQFFVIGTILLLLSRRYFNMVVALLGMLLIASMILTGYISYIYDYIPTMDQQFYLLRELYYPPWTRIGPYIVGMMTGYIFLKLDKKLKLKKKTLIILWILGSSCNVFVLFGLANRQISVIASAFYSALSRTVWGVGIAWVIIACSTNNAGVINKILSFRAWVPLSKLTYCAYLLNPILIPSVYLHGETSLHIDFLRNTTVFLGNFMITYICSYAFTLMFETPYVLLMRQIMNSLNRKM